MLINQLNNEMTQIIDNNKIIYDNYKKMSIFISAELKKDHTKKTFNELKSSKAILKSYTNDAKKAYIEGIRESNAIYKLFIDYSKNRDVNVKHTPDMLIEGINNVELLLKLQNNNREKLDKIKEDAKDSMELFNCIITFTDWIEELQDNNPMGLLFTVESSKYSRSGINWRTNNVIPSSTIYPLSDFMSKAVDIAKYTNINNMRVINDRILGECNCIIPLYINKYHWNLAKHYIKPCMSAIIYHDPLIYKKECMYYIFNIFTDMTATMSKADENKIRIYINFLRTCAEIAFMFKFNRGIRGVIKNFLNNPKLNCIYDYKRYIGQILCTGYIMTEADITTFSNNVINILCAKLSKNKMEYNKDILSMFIKMNNILNEMYKKIGSYNKFLKLLEDNYGYLPGEYTTFVHTQLK